MSTIVSFGLTKLQRDWIGKALPYVDAATILDIAQSKNGDEYVLCFLANNPIHHYVTWLFSPTTQRVYSGHYVFTVTEGVDDLRMRAGIYGTDQESR